MCTTKTGFVLLTLIYHSSFSLPIAPTAPPQGVTASPQDPTTLVINWQPPQWNTGME